MTREEHIARHVALHAALDELFADFLVCNPACIPSTTRIGELMQWSYGQTGDPSEACVGVHPRPVCAHCGSAIATGEAHQCESPEKEGR
jgi:hypothetical protein